MKKILAILLALAMVLALTACGGSNNAAAPSEPPKEAEKTVDFDDPWFTATKGTVARREIQHHESSSNFLDGVFDDVYDEVYAFDADDNELYVRGFDVEGLKYENTFEYDADGNQVLWTASNETDGLYFTRECIYENGLCVKEIETENGNVDTTEYEYNGKGWPSKITYTSGNNWGNYVTEYDYNENGDVTYEYCVREENGFYESTYTYEGELLMKQVYDSVYGDGTKNHAMTTYEYNENGKCVKQVDNYDGEESVTVYEYDENNNRISEKYSSPDWSYEYRYEYNDNGNVTRMTVEYTDGESCEELYEYDSEGRVVRDEYTSKMNGEFSYSYLITYAYE